MKRYIYCFTILLINNCIGEIHKTTLLDYIDPRIGVIDNRMNNCVIGPQLPFGSVNPSPHTANGLHDGYNPNDKIRGFAQLHVSGTGWGKYGQFLVSPQVDMALGEEDHDSEKSGEIAKANYYKVHLDRYGITAELTPGNYAVMYRFTFPESKNASVLIDITHSLTIDIAKEVGGSVKECYANIDPETMLFSGGGIYEGGFGSGNYPLYFAALFGKTPNTSGAWKNGVAEEILEMVQEKKGDKIGLFANFTTKKDESIMLKIAVSFKSIAQAKNFLTEEFTDWDFDKAREKAANAWEQELRKIELPGASAPQKTLFYTALYHSMLMPRNRSRDNRYGYDDYPFWDDHFAVWDTWRTVFPLLTLLRPDVVADNINAFIGRFENFGLVRDAFVAGNDMWAEQGGNNVDNIISDAILKDLEGFDYQEAYKLLKHNADRERNGWQDFSKPKRLKNNKYKEQGWIPGGIISCSTTLEYSYNDYCISRVADKLGYMEDSSYYLSRSKGWKNLWNPNLKSGGFSGFIGPKDKDGKWINIDVEKNWHSWNLYFYEANSWTYLAYNPQQIKEAIELSGGENRFVEKLDYGLRNNYVIRSNEPAFTYTRAFTFANRPDLTSYWVRKSIEEGYDETGYPGNDDSGAMSSWYIFSTLGVYPLAGDTTYILNSPLFKESKITLPNKRTLTILAPEASPKNIYIKSCSFNGTRLKKTTISHESIMSGGILEFELGSVNE